MSATVHYLHAQPTEIGHFLRIGSSGHRQLETLHAAEVLHVRRAIFEASRMPHQSDLSNTLVAHGAEIVVDLNAAEASAIGKQASVNKLLPWGHKERPLSPADFRNQEIYNRMAHFGIEHSAHALLSPSHLLEGFSDGWHVLNIQSCERLRAALDRRGATAIALDYQLIVPYSALRNDAERRAFVASLKGLPFDNLWLRVAGFGADAEAPKIRRLIEALWEFDELGKPLILDHVGGLAGLAPIGFGAVGALSHGVLEKERFDAAHWKKAPRGGGGGHASRIYFPTLDRALKASDAERLLEARGARRLLGCRDACCVTHSDNILGNPKAHFLRQRKRQLDDLSNVPESRRAEHFLSRHLAEADRASRQATRLRTGSNSLTGVLHRNSVRLDRTRSVLESLRESMDEQAPFAVAPRLRSGSTRGTSRTGSRNE